MKAIAENTTIFNEIINWHMARCALHVCLDRVSVFDNETFGKYFSMCAVIAHALQ